MNTDELQGWLIERLAQMRGMAPGAIDIRERLSRYGVSSVDAVRLITELSGTLGRRLSPTLVWEHPTIEALAMSLAGAAEPTAARAGVPREHDVHEPVAVVGMACRFPKASDLKSFWQLLRDGGSAVSQVPDERGWDEVLSARGVDSAERAKVRRGGFLDRIDGFEPLFFGISPREASSMDPQQRLMLELCWEALEDAGIQPSSLKGSETSVFAGAIWSDYVPLLYRGGPEGLGQYTVTGHHHSIIANRISYVFGLEGPSLTLDSACSSGLVTAHLACESLRRGESTLALAGAVNLNILPESALAVSRFGALSEDGRCYTFDARANGYVRGEGGGVAVLKTLSRAIADGDRIYCVIRGSAVNNDGASNGMTAPSPKAQEAVLRAAYRRAGVDVAAVQYVEAHGTGTPLGDPIEAKALGAVLGTGRPAEAPLLVGSAKTNVGHLEGAAGIVGLMKVGLSIHHRLLPPSLNFESPNPLAPLAELGLAVPTSLGPWPAPGKRLLAGVSSFGLGGTNGHVVLEEWPAPRAEALTLEAESPDALRAAVEALRVTLSADAGRMPLKAICTDAAARRGPAQERLAVVTHTEAHLDGALAAFLSGEANPALHTSGAAIDASRGVVFVFPGQGAQWYGMAQSLLQGEPVFRAAIEGCDRYVRQYLGWSLIGELTVGRAASRLDDIDVSLPAIISIGIAVAAWWRSLGVEPAAVVGHSTGEIAAAHVAGALDLDDTMRVICAYGRVIARQVGQGGMALVGLPWEQAAEALASFDGRVFRAIQDSVNGTVVAGEPRALEVLVEGLQAKGVFCRHVAMNVAPHCPLADSLRDELFEALKDIRPRRGSVPFISEVTETELDGKALDAAHWVRNFGDAAFFSGAVNELIRRGHRVFLDVGPHPITKHSVEANLRHAGVRGEVLSSLRRDEDERGTLLDTLGALYTLGLPVRWDELYPRGCDGASAGAPSSEVSGPDGAAWLLPLSAKSAEGLLSLAGAYGELLRHGAHEAHLRDVAYTASVRRDHHAHRFAVVGRTRAEMAEVLAAFVRDGMALAGVHGQSITHRRPKLVFVFPGQGSQWVGMGRTLLEQEPVFREAIETCDGAIRREASFSVLEELRADAARSRLGEIDVVQPVLFAIEVALAALWWSWGVEPDAVVGHSMGEVAAAYVAGALSLGDAAAVICRRSRLLRTVSGKGAMALVELSMVEAERRLGGYADRLSVAVSNGPRSTVIAGAPAALEEVLGQLEREKVFCRRVKVDVASHSPQMDGLRDELLAALSGLSPKAASVRMPSTVTGERVNGEELGAEYWADNLRKPVLFSRVIRGLCEEGHTLFVEMSPHPILLPSVEENLRESKAEGGAIGSLRRQVDERRSLLESVGRLYVHGYPVAFQRLYPEGGRVVDLPTYPWQRERFWVESGAQARGAPRGARRAGKGGSEHPLLGAPFFSSAHLDERMWEQGLSVEATPYLADHRVQGEVVLPGAGYVEMALAAGAATLGAADLVLEEVVFEQMLALADKGERIVQVVLTEQGTGRCSFQIASRAEEARVWTKHASGAVRVQGGEAGPERARELPDALKQRLGPALPAAAHYRRMRGRQIDYGPAFQGLLELWTGEGEALGKVRLPDEVEDSGYTLHPALLDACLQVSAALFPDVTETYVPVGIRRLQVRARPSRQAWVMAMQRGGEGADGGDAICDLWVVDDEGRIVVELEGLRARRLGAVAGGAKDALAGCIHVVAWRGVEPLPEPSLPVEGTWLVLVDRSGVGVALGARLSVHGRRCVRAVPGSAYERLEPDLYCIDPSKPDDYLRLLRELFGEEERCLGAVHLFSLDATPIEATTPESLLLDLVRGSVSAASLAQAIVRHGFRDVPRLYLVTRGAQAVLEGEPVAVAQAPLLGLGKTIALEHPELKCTRIDLRPTADEGDAELLMRELGARDREDQIALRSDGRYVARLVRGAFERDEPTPNALVVNKPTPEVRLSPVRWETAIPIRADRSYLITGGLGGLGLVLARWLVAQGARHLALVGRRGPGHEAQQAIGAMEEAGAQLECVQADVSQRSEVERLFSRIGERLPPLGGIVHAAAVLDDHTLLEQSEESFRKVFGPKALGAWNLHALCEGLELDFFVMYSSAASLFGSPGQSNYTAANALLDALSHERARRALVSMSIQWGAFAEVGLSAAQDNRGKRLSSRGIASFTPAEGLEALRRLFERPRTEVGVMRFDARRWIEFYPGAAGLPFLAEAMTEDPFYDGDGEEVQHLLERLKSMNPRERLYLLERLLLEEAGSVLRLDPSRIDRFAPFQSLGMDSLTSLELRNRIETTLGSRLSATLLFTYPTASSLAEHLLERLGIEGQGDEAEVKGPTAPEARAQKLVELELSLDQLSDEELLARLSDKLGPLPDHHERNRS
jgi:acyl transferase domain-containing protein/NAD(P)-dependent dehydrogenase (short-subunit alcohol dehydrogenase family)/acyl carrier protein